MSAKQLTAEAIARPLAEKASFAQALRPGFDPRIPDSGEGTVKKAAVRRDEELPGGKVTGLGHKEAMWAVRRAMGSRLS